MRLASDKVFESRAAHVPEPACPGLGKPFALRFVYAPDDGAGNGGGAAAIAEPPAAGQQAPAGQQAAQAPPAEPVIPSGSTVSAADLYVQQQEAAAAAAAAAGNPPAGGQQTPPAGQQAAQQTPPAGQQAGQQTPPAGQQAGQQAAADQWQSARAYAASLGLQGADQYPDDAAFLQHLIAARNEAEQLRQIAPYATQYMQHAGQFQQFLQQQQAAQQQAQTPKPLFELPEWNPAWNALLAKDAQGNVTVVPGADPSILAKYHQHQRARTDLANRFLDNPEAFLAPVVEQRVGTMLEKLVDERLGKVQTQNENQRYIEQNSAWLFAQDQANRPVINPGTGTPVLSPAGQRFVQHLQAATQMGMNERAARLHAETQLRLEMSQLQLAQLLAKQQGAAGNQQVIDANRQPNQGGSFHGSMPGGSGAPQNPSASLKDQLAMALAQGGITDAHIKDEI